MMPTRFDGLRHVAWIRNADTAEARRLMDEMDGFVLRTRASPVEAVAPSSDNPFLVGMQDALTAFSPSPGVAIGRDTLQSQYVGELPGTMDRQPKDADEIPEGSGTDVVLPSSEQYRAKMLSDFFGGDLQVADFTGPVFGVLGAWTDIDFTSLVTAKVSGFMIKDTGSTTFVRPWGGHRTTYSEAEQLGILEGVERLGAETPGHLAHVETPENLRRISTDGFGLADSQWRIPHPEVRSWTRGESMLTSWPVELPTRLVYFNADLDETHWVQDSSNGCAIGGSPEEAQLFGLLEAIERDAFLACWYAALPLNEIRTDSVSNPVSRAFLNRMALCGQTVRFFDATVGVNIPTVIAVCTETGGSACVGAGSHPDAERALHSALIEVASDFQVVAQHRREREDELAEMLGDYNKVQRMEDHADMFAHPDARPLLSPWLDTDHDVVSLKSLVRPDAGYSVRQDLHVVLSACAEADLEPIAVPTQTRMADELGASCWKVVVPGLIPIDFGFSYQRALRMSRLEELHGEFWVRKGQDQEFVPYLVPHPFP